MDQIYRMSEQELVVFMQKYPHVQLPWNDPAFYVRPSSYDDDDWTIPYQPFSEDFLREWMYCVDMKHFARHIHWYSQDFLDELIYVHKINLLDLVLAK
jgi:hypothetical protein